MQMSCAQPIGVALGAAGRSRAFRGKFESRKRLALTNAELALGCARTSSYGGVLRYDVETKAVELKSLTHL